ncbi:hypothetical protein H633G_10271 [Metarhizium anisopliae BRIP 53284]|nr:hypothetical protein H633G_10271 [Metarhizium anisopliae BRIP 53284]
MGDSLPPWLVFAHYPTTNWAGIDIGTGVRFAQSPTGFSNAEIHLEWARHFNRWSWVSSAQAKQSGKTLEQWFGCDEHLRLPDRGMSRVERPPVDRPDEEKIYRLLVVDGFTGHTTLAFAEYCIKFDIIIAILPPHSTHLMQPLDVGVFQPLKAAHQKALRRSLAEGNLTFSRIDFLAAFQQVYEAGFTRHNIMSGFEETGLWPASPQPVLAKLLQEQLRQRKRINPAYTSLLPSETWFQVAADAANDIRERYHDILSSPSREGLRQIAKKKRGKTVRPSGEFVTSSSMDDIVRENEQLQDRQTKERTRKELRMHISQVKGQMQKIRDDYKKTKKQVVNGRAKQLNFKPWLEHTGRDVEFYLLEQSHDSLTQELKRPPQDIYFIDTTKRNNSARDTRARAMTRPHPLEDMSSLPGSDDTVHFPGLGPFHKEGEEDNNDDLEIKFHDAQEYMPSSPPALAAVEDITNAPCPVKPTRRYHHIQRMLKGYRNDRNSSKGHDTGENSI